MEPFKWTTTIKFSTNQQIMQYYLEQYNMLDVVSIEGGGVVFATNALGEKYKLSASSDGSDYKHKVVFELITK